MLVQGMGGGRPGTVGTSDSEKGRGQQGTARVISHDERMICSEG